MQESVGVRLRELRRAAGMTIAQLAAVSGISARTISDVERGHSSAPHAHTLAALAEALGAGDRGGLTVPAGELRAPATGGELPRGVRDFVGRAAELALVERHAAGRGGPAPMVLVHGPAGIGKTAFALRAADALRDSYPDGRFHLDLRGTGTPLSGGEAVHRLLRVLGVAPRRLAETAEERSAQLRAVLSRRRCLLVLDDADGEAQLRPLLPAGGPALVLVTARSALAGLEGALRIGLPPLAPAESAALLGAVAAQAAGPAAAGAVAELGRLCGHLPLALRIAGTRLAGRPGWTVGHLVDRLADPRHRLANLAAGDAAMADAIAASHTRLSAAGRALFRRLALAPGPEFGPGLAAVLAGTGPAAAGAVLEELADLGLLQPEGPDRYRFHELVRLFAADRLAAEEPAADRAAAERRVAEWRRGGPAVRLPAPAHRHPWVSVSHE